MLSDLYFTSNPLVDQWYACLVFVLFAGKALWKEQQQGDNNSTEDLLRPLVNKVSSFFLRMTEKRGCDFG
jgi:hypothetical protein